ncbi:hypothetical protein GYMLUDRAFT_225945 [Collybiopsis luxurians FD-317 M1]|uniref:ABC transporter domain-containing protein n=1 Tax=Collybiopsis luxurians FD-317 M1 TaxID=944289 RepID=A0A0D0BXH9_9AGAR|nr:hypothetical protein GYMLUDRAFT_225945 [Collybiopsis luxurians FD-317 M1]
MFRGRRLRARRGNPQGKFDPDDEKKVKYTRLNSVWELYEGYSEDSQSGFSLLPTTVQLTLAPYLGLLENLPFVWKMLKDIGSIRACWFYLGLYLIGEFALSLIPAVQLWLSGQLLSIVEIAVEQRTVNKRLLLHVAFGRIASSIVEFALERFVARISRPLNSLIKQFYDVNLFRVLARMDVPTFDDPIIQRQLEEDSPSDPRGSIVWRTVTSAVHIASTTTTLISELFVLYSVLKNQQDGLLLAFSSFLHPLLESAGEHMSLFTGVWAATTRNADFIKMSGLRQAIRRSVHRKEIVAGDMWEYLLSEYRRCVAALGEDVADFIETLHNHYTRRHFSVAQMLRQPLQELPQIIFTLRAVQHPKSIPLSLASINLITSSTTKFSGTLQMFLIGSGSISENFAMIRKLYEIMNLGNRIPDGTIPYPENQQSLRTGMSIEFRNVSFKYPGSSKYALKNVSFKIGKGQLCVILGENGSGKSTILKLIARLYDLQEGQILIDDQDIRTLALADLRRTMAILFQDYTHFPLSIRENIALGDPKHANDIERITQAANLGGASKFVEALDEGYDTYLERPIRDHYSGLPEGTTKLFGRTVNFGPLRNVGGMATSEATTLSGGQMQRIALSRTFMRSLISELSVGLLLFDEPSASLDPGAEHDLFERLRLLRGQKTMLFSSHRFGKLTRNADIILYMHDSVIVEEGSHDKLIKAKGEYARIWNLQAQAFL